MTPDPSDIVDALWRLVLAVGPDEVPIISRDEVVAVLVGKEVEA